MCFIEPRTIVLNEIKHTNNWHLTISLNTIYVPLSGNLGRKPGLMDSKLDSRSNPTLDGNGVKANPGSFNN